MPHLDDVLERLVTDADFRRALDQDPDQALSAYSLTAEERQVLDATISGSPGAASSGAVEGRQSKSAMVGMLSQLAEGAPSSARAGDDVAFDPQPEPPGGEEEGIIIYGRPTDGVGNGEDAGIIIIGGKPGEDVGFNPQPDPPIAERGTR